LRSIDPRAVMRADRRMHRLVKPRALVRPRTVFRYTSQKRAKWERQYGLSPGRHMTAIGGPGRPLSRAGAQGRYGLPQAPAVRETIHLPKGRPVRSMPAAGGDGSGELSSPYRIPPNAITQTVPLR
jgi:hypothetical protein